MLDGVFWWDAFPGTNLIHLLRYAEDLRVFFYPAGPYVLRLKCESLSSPTTQSCRTFNVRKNQLAPFITICLPYPNNANC